jgi:polyhydroxyalkanoate synthesis regulator phasin
MLELLKKGLFAGIGAVVLTTEKIQDSIKRLVEEGKITTEEGEKLTDDLIKSGERQWDEINAKIAEKSKSVSQSLDLVRKKELEALKARVERIEQHLGLIGPPSESSQPE